MARNRDCGPFFIVGIESNAGAQGIVGGFGDSPLTSEVESCPILTLMRGRCGHTSNGSGERARSLRFNDGGLLSRYVFFSGTLSGQYS